MGLLGKIAQKSCFIEVFWNQPNPQQVRSCLVKLYLKYNELYNQAKNQNQPPPEEKELPSLWVITTSASDELTKGFKAENVSPWCQGVYLFGEFYKTAIVAINQLPTTPETLWLRILGKGKIRQTAIEKIIALPESHPLRNDVLKLIYDYLKKIEGKSQKTEEDEELIMGLSPAYYQWEKETIEKAKKEGMHQERLGMVENLLKVRFGEIDESLAQVIEPLVQLSQEESSYLIIKYPREDLLTKLSH